MLPITVRTAPTRTSCTAISRGLDKAGIRHTGISRSRGPGAPARVPRQGYPSPPLPRVCPTEHRAGVRPDRPAGIADA